MTPPAQSTQVHAALRHESAALHVTGQARYVDDMALPENSVHIALGLSDVAHGQLISIKLKLLCACQVYGQCLQQLIFPKKTTAAR